MTVLSLVLKDLHEGLSYKSLLHFIRPQLVKSLVIAIFAHVVKVCNSYALALIIYKKVFLQKSLKRFF